jgi:uncharacterized protein
MTQLEGAGEGPIEAGDFGRWITEIHDAVRGVRGSEVPCGGCTACCTSSQFVHIAPDEIDTLAHIPKELLFPAPRSPRGHVVLGYDERGHCPMLVNDQCSIYQHRPRTCRTYDCRVFPAAGLEVDDRKALIAERARRWQFTFGAGADRTERDAVQAAARFLGEHPDLLPDGASATSTTQRAVLAIEIHNVFLHIDEETRQLALVDPDPAVVRTEIARVAGGRPRPTDG